MEWWQFLVSAVVAALVALLVTLLVEYLAKPRLEARKEAILQRMRDHREVLKIVQAAS